jgi:hypothetical protein
LDHVAICVQFLIFLWSKIFLLDEVVTWAFAPQSFCCTASC